MHKHTLNPLPTISIIVPIYNASKYIKKCIQSIVKQTYQNFELLLINDGSTDNSLNICNQLAYLDNRITIINQDHQGLEQTRINGIKIIKGQYLVFIDADDWIVPSYLETLLNKSIEYNADIVQINSYKTIDKYGILKIKCHHYKEQLYTSHQLKKYNNNYLERLIPNNVWGKLYKASLFNNLKITPWNIHWGEDVHFNLIISPFISSIYFTNVFGYYYRYGGSTASYDPRFWPNHCTLYQKRKEYIETYDPQYIHVLRWQLTEQYKANISLMIRFSNHDKYSIIDFIEKTFSSEIYNELMPESISDKKLAQALSNKNVFQIYEVIKSQPNFLNTLKTKTASFLSRLFN